MRPRGTVTGGAPACVGALARLTLVPLLGAEVGAADALADGLAATLSEPLEEADDATGAAEGTAGTGAGGAGALVGTSATTRAGALSSRAATSVGRLQKLYASIRQTPRSVKPTAATTSGRTS